MKVLIACECSGTVRDAFLELGHDAWSCDLKPCEQRSNRVRRHVRVILAGSYAVCADEVRHNGGYIEPIND